MSISTLFRNVVTCLRMYTNNVVSSIYTEDALKSDGKLVTYFQKHPSWYLNKQEFNDTGLSTGVLYLMFYPHDDPTLFENLMYRFKDDKQVLELLASQYQSQQQWQAYFNWITEFQPITRSHLDRLLTAVNAYPDGNIMKSIRVCLNSNWDSITRSIDIPKPKQLMRASMRNAFPDYTQHMVLEEDVNTMLAVLQKQFEHMTIPGSLDDVIVRREIQKYADTHFKEFVSVVSTWKMMHKLNSNDMAFLNNFNLNKATSKIAKDILDDGVMLRPGFKEESYTVYVFMKYLTELLNQNVRVIVIDSETNPFQRGKSGGFTTFVYRQGPNQYMPISVAGQNVFTPKSMPETNFKKI